MDYYEEIIKINKNSNFESYIKNNVIVHKYKPTQNPINKSTLINPKALNTKRKPFIITGVSIITCTKRAENINNIFNNFKSQVYTPKELIIILNNNRMDIKVYIDKAKEFNNVKVYKLEEKITLGECLNFAVEKAKYNVIAKFDDDDYYAPKYLSDSLKAFNYTDADVIGKSTSYVYFKKDKTLAIRNPKKENRYVFRVEGPTLIIKKEVFDKVKFADKNLGEDVQFCKDCYKNGIKIYSHNRFNHVYIRHGNQGNHTWGISDNYYKKLCRIIGKVNDYKTKCQLS
ncbi:glycosyltransferase [Caldisalinibacter kiritimatiensis]|uniref:Putative glycosyltransferase n=1 Tax=Caldisalinibacter kiritimatiensis TaxID=1304284 RepID=R1CMP1_9FIRM|nr:glycosyltransferase [Caldisalinibacter kiritimatiensis]EOC99965.1 Putative glycosyltransferase [Caldisalinibacter kiritimatiensis]